MAGNCYKNYDATDAAVRGKTEFAGEGNEF